MKEVVLRTWFAFYHGKVSLRNGRTRPEPLEVLVRGEIKIIKASIEGVRKLLQL